MTFRLAHASPSLAVLSMVAASWAAPAAADPAPELPAKSPLVRVEQQVGLTPIWVEYSSPARRGRTIWGELVPYGELWRTGANANTLLHVGRDGMVGGKAVSAGTYGLLTIPGRERWTVILSSKTDGGGTGSYDESLDVARFEVTATAAPERERMTFIFSNTTDSSTRLDLEWAGQRVSIPIEVPTRDHVEAEIAQATANAWQAHERSARYLLDQGEDLDRALALIEASIAIAANWRNHWVKAQILGAKGQKKDAIRSAKKAKQLGDDSGAFRFYAPQMDAAMARWKGKS